jgi:hypothetical protein
MAIAVADPARESPLFDGIVEQGSSGVGGSGKGGVHRVLLESG